MLSFVLFFYVAGMFVGEAPDITGDWVYIDGEIRMNVYKNAQGHYCGKITWLKEGTENHRVKYDIKNPDKQLRSRTLVGTQILYDFKYDASSMQWKQGRIYHPKYGKRFRGKMFLENSNTLVIRGYWGFFSEKGVWYRDK